jgi:hypothetical protein
VILRECLANVDSRIISHDSSLTVERHRRFRKNASNTVDCRDHRLKPGTCLKNENESERIAAKVPMVDRLLNTILEHVEVLLGEVKDELTAWVCHGDRYNHLVRANADLGLADGGGDCVWLSTAAETAALNDNVSAHRNVDLLRLFITTVYAILFTFKGLQEGLPGDLRTSLVC